MVAFNVSNKAKLHNVGLQKLSGKCKTNQINSAEIVRKLVLKCSGTGGTGQVLGLMNIIAG